MHVCSTQGFKPRKGRKSRRMKKKESFPPLPAPFSVSASTTRWSQSQIPSCKKSRERLRMLARLLFPVPSTSEYAQCSLLICTINFPEERHGGGLCNTGSGARWGKASLQLADSQRSCCRRNDTEPHRSASRTPPHMVNHAALLCHNRDKCLSGNK